MKGLYIHKEDLMRQYETGFVLSPGLSEEDAGAFIRQMADVISQKKGKMVKQDIWGKRRLAFPIKRFNEGIYVFFLYEGAGDISQELERRFKQSDSVIRFLTIKKDAKDAFRKKKRAAREAAAAAAQAAPAPEATPAPAAGEEK
jgi:small subunit ribosomal protein S6